MFWGPSLANRSKQYKNLQWRLFWLSFGRRARTLPAFCANERAKSHSLRDRAIAVPGPAEPDPTGFGAPENYAAS